MYCEEHGRWFVYDVQCMQKVPSEFQRNRAWRGFEYLSIRAAGSVTVAMRGSRPLLSVSGCGLEWFPI